VFFKKNRNYFNKCTQRVLILNKFSKYKKIFIQKKNLNVIILSLKKFVKVVAVK
jgi:hypothetical protein